MGVAAYLRVSTDDQADRGTIETQRQEIRRYCERHGIQDVAYYEDPGVSGTIPLGSRPEGARLLEDARSGKFDTLLVYRVDRLGRKTLITLSAISMLDELGITLVSITENVDLSTPAGVLQATMLSGFAAFERDSIIQRSIAGTERLAKEGAWLGGIVPYGYYVTGKDREARLTVSEDLLPGFHLSEADVIRLIYRLAAEEGRSCVAIAEHLNSLGVPPSYAKDERKIKVSETRDRGKRTAATAGIWRAGRILNMLKNETYKGVHVYGKRSKKNRERITRQVPAIVTPEQWERAQQVLRGNYLFSRRDAKRDYLLRGLIKCEKCGLTYIASGDERSGKVYYRCNGRTNRRVIAGSRHAHKCEAASVGMEVEEAVWSDIESFLRNPGEVLHQLEEQRRSNLGSVEKVHRQIADLGRAIERKTDERKKVLDAYRKELITEAELIEQRNAIQAEEAALKAERDRLQEQARATEIAQSELHAAEELLLELNRRLDSAVTWETRRRLVEVLVDTIRVDTVDRDGRKEAHVSVRYRFHVGNDCTDGRATSTAG